MKYFVNEDREMLIRRVEELYRIRQEDFRIIESEERNLPWLNEKRAEINFENGFWGRYRDYLGDEKNFPPDTIDKLDTLTDKILDSMFDPTENVQIDKKGLVVGQVQSGKTANYTGLICKAADAGYKLIIILAGIHNNLRSQTQLRIDESFLGFDTQYARAYNQNNYYIGVGKLGSPIVAHSLTSSLEKGDFTQGAAASAGISFDTNEPIIAVVKKNPKVLERIYKWLGSKTTNNPEDTKIIRSKALLLIDDEADMASINISNDPEKSSTINGWITGILSLFRRSGYVRYTATPFANIFIPLDDKNLFPRDFIINIPAPSNYIGPERIFGFSLIEDEERSETVLPIINRISDYDQFVPNKHKKDDQLPSSIPDSLKRAIRCFILTSAIRRLRGQTTVHNSMLIHVSRFVRWQDYITELVRNIFNYYRRGIDQNDSAIVNEFKATFESDEDNYRSYVTVSGLIQNSALASLDSQIQVHSWTDVLNHLNDAASRIEVRAIHGGSGEALDYYEHKNGLSVIAVGGNKLSRGLT
ncbi:MAG: endonuclease, partial [Bacteroidetes bacterium]|nr:endonuclease [Bacteroidota bacterium]